MTNIAISNLAWQKDDDERVFELMANLNVRHLEISPFRESADLSAIGNHSARVLIDQINKYGIRVISLQALLFRYPELVIFKDASTREKTFDHLMRVIDFANELGAKKMIFGCPKNKIRGEMQYDDAFDIAKDFFSRLAQRAERDGIIFCIEPTPAVYGADFIRDTNEAITLIKAVNSNALKVNLDIGSSMMNNEKIEDSILNNTQYIGHVHISEPHLQKINLDSSFHKKNAQTIRASSYKGAVSIEMLPQSSNNIEGIYKTLSFVSKIYT